MKLNHNTLKALHQALLNWYDKHQRQMPWRGCNNPYAIWISEIMLQQTQVATVTDYYQRFIKAFPTVEKLANTSQDKVLKLWQGLGYYRRGINLHRCAIELVESHHGQLPQTVDELTKLPGIGPYTAGAIASIAFNQRASVLDGNVKRVYCRLFAIGKDIRKPSTEKELWQIARDCLAPDRPGDYNQALMDLGATICTPKAPQCDTCPLSTQCQARRHNTQQQLPYKSPAKAVPHHHVAIGIVIKKGKILINKRPDDAMLGGLWEFPGGKVEPDETPQQCAAREIKEEMNIDVTVHDQLTTIKHAYSHFKVTLHAFICRHQRGRVRNLAGSDFQWVTLDKLHDYAFPRGSLKIIDALHRHADHYSL